VELGLSGFLELTWVGRAGLSPLDPLDVGRIHPSDRKGIGNWTPASTDDHLGRKPECSVLGRYSAPPVIWLVQRTQRVIVGIVTVVVLDR
jgi:hypothetical protein